MAVRCETLVNNNQLEYKFGFVVPKWVICSSGVYGGLASVWEGDSLYFLLTSYVCDRIFYNV